MSSFITHWVTSGGIVLVFVLMAAESCGVPFPSEVIMPFAGFLAAQGHINLPGAILAGTLGNVAGSVVAYALAARRVRVNAILPGIVDTAMQDEVLAKVAPMRDLTAEEWRDARNKAVPLGRGASADECAGLIWFLLSEDAGYMTGQAINYTGGLVTW